MDEKDMTLAIELLVNHLVHLRAQVDILQEQLERQGALPAELVSRELDRTWTTQGDQAVEAFWSEFERIRQESE